MVDGNLQSQSRTRESKSDSEVIVKSDISVIDGRSAGISSTIAPTTATPIAESFKMVTKQLLQAPSATDMVATDVRTPPRVKSQVKSEIADFVPLGKGEAHPVLMDDTSAYEIVTSAPPKPSTPPSTAGLSTWILLSNGEQSTLATKKKGTVAPTVEPKKKPPPIAITPAPEKGIKKNEEKVGKPGIVKPVPAPVKKANITREDPPKASALVLQDSKFKNRTPVVVGRIPAIEKTDTNNSLKKVASTTPTATIASTTAPTKRKTTQTSTKYSPDIVPTTSLLLETDTVEAVEETSTTEPTSTTTKRTRRPTNKKKKKNKNRRRRPSKPDSDQAESKITDDNAVASKIENNRPISTRIYNYLAREVMPSVGVGIVGLMLTAGLAGLFLYPFGGTIARRNYDKAPTPLSSDSHMYYYNSYSPHPEPEPNNAQPEEKVFGQVLSSMNQNTFNPSPPYDGSKYSASNHKYRYDIHDYSVNGYAGTSDYSTLPDSVKNGGDYPPPDSSKYYSMDPITTHYKLTDTSSQPETFKPERNNYPSLTEYTSYTNAASVGTVSSYENSGENKRENETSVGEDKSDKSAPQFSALVGSPHFTNTDFVGSVSLTGSYGAQEIRHRTGAQAASDHGPRSLPLKRTKRDVHDDFNNEIDSTDEKILRKPSEAPTTKSPTNKLETTTGFNYFTKTEPSLVKDGTTVNYENNVVTDSSTDTTTDTVTNATNESGYNKDVTDSPDNSNNDDEDNISSTDGNNDSGFLGFLRRLAQVKLKLGLSLLRSTGEAFQRYLNVMAKRMETAVRNMETKRRSAQNPQWTSVSSSRQRRYTLPNKLLQKKVIKQE
ncbi:uncharacterized protein isoform X2 [Rhodnius prolixus]|uniref:uncharacterized protein isoform X2 n=1 Tax=Rhodnius prolixus TaxID=13249 RepID=UPI003D18D4C4